MATSNRSLSPMPTFVPDETAHRKAIANWIREANQGKLMNVGSITLTDNAASTIVTEPRAGANSFIGLMPTTSNASLEIGAGTIYIATQGFQTFTITHANNAQTDRTFRYCILG